MRVKVGERVGFEVRVEVRVRVGFEGRVEVRVRAEGRVEGMPAGRRPLSRGHGSRSRRRAWLGLGFGLGWLGIGLGWLGLGIGFDLVDAQVEQTRRVLGDERGHDLLRGRG